MGKIKKYKNAVERFLSGEGGQRFFNFAYSIGAAIVILGALFKILHLTGGNALLCIGMGTEVLMFVLTAFDRPGRDYHWEEVFPVFNTHNPEDRPSLNGGGGSGVVINGNIDSTSESEDGTIFINAPQPAAQPVAGIMPDNLEQLEELTATTQSYLSQMASIADEMRRLKETTEALNKVSIVLLDSYRAITDNSANITASTTGYIDQMQALNRNVSGLNTIYEIQLKSVSSQLDAIDRVNQGIKEISRMYETTSAKSERYCEETEKMAENMRQLNSIYEKMLHAMTINMYHPMSAAPEPRQAAPDQNL